MFREGPSRQFSLQCKQIPQLGSSQQFDNRPLKYLVAQTETGSTLLGVHTHALALISSSYPPIGLVQNP